MPSRNFEVVTEIVGSKPSNSNDAPGYIPKLICLSTLTATTIGYFLGCKVYSVGNHTQNLHHKKLLSSPRWILPSLSKAVEHSFKTDFLQTPMYPLYMFSNQSQRLDVVSNAKK